MAKLVSKVYGDALFETAMEKEIMDTLYEETSALLPILQEIGRASCRERV